MNALAEPSVVADQGTIREFDRSDKDFQDLNEVLNVFKPSNTWTLDGMKEFFYEKIFSDPTVKVYVLVVDNRIVSCVFSSYRYAAIHNGTKIYDIDEVGTHPNHRGHHYGVRLTNHAADCAFNEGADKILLRCDEWREVMYREKCQFQTCGVEMKRCRPGYKK